MRKKNKWLTRTEAWVLAKKLSEMPRYGNVQAVAKKLGIAQSTIYKWGAENGGDPDVRITIDLKDLAIKEGVLKG